MNEHFSTKAIGYMEKMSNATNNQGNAIKNPNITTIKDMEKKELLLKKKTTIELSYIPVMPCLDMHIYIYIYIERERVILSNRYYAPKFIAALLTLVKRQNQGSVNCQISG
jgi:hypothetical protein